MYGTDQSSKHLAGLSSVVLRVGRPLLDARVGNWWMEDPPNFSEKGSSSLLSKFGNSAVTNRWCRSPDLALACIGFAGWPGLVEQSDQRLPFWNRGDYCSHSVDTCAETRMGECKRERGGGRGYKVHFDWHGSTS